MWKEEVLKTLELHEARQAEFGVPEHGKPGWSIDNTAKELGVSPATVIYNLKIAKFLRENPNVNLKSKTEAMRLLYRKDRRIVRYFEHSGTIVKTVIFDKEEHFVIRLTNPLGHVKYIFVPAKDVEFVR